eukprot:COSAG04_NODE_1616_length_6142_cov_2.434883_5_plen_431_part_00
MARTVGPTAAAPQQQPARALRPLDSNTPAASSSGGCAHTSADAPRSAAASAPPAGSGAPASPSAAAPSGTFVPAATQDAVASAVASDHMKGLTLSPEASAGGAAQGSPAWTVPDDSVRSLPSEQPAQGVGVDEFLTMSLHYVPHAASLQDGNPAGNFRPCAQRVASPVSDDGCDIEARIPECDAHDLAAGRVLVALQLANSHAEHPYTVQLRVDGGPPEIVTVAPRETVLAMAPRAGSGSPQPFETSRGAPVSPRSAFADTSSSVSVVFSRPEPLGIVFDEIADERDGTRYLVVNGVHPNTQAAEMTARTIDPSATSNAALIQPVRYSSCVDLFKRRSSLNNAAIVAPRAWWFSASAAVTRSPACSSRPSTSSVKSDAFSICVLSVSLTQKYHYFSRPGPRAALPDAPLRYGPRRPHRGHHRGVAGAAAG